MEIGVLYINAQGSRITRVGERLLVRDRDDKILEDVPFFRVKQVICFGSVEITGAAIIQLLRLGIDVVYMSLAGRFKCRLSNMNPAQVKCRQSQYAKAADAGFRLRIARAMLSGKLLNAKSFLVRRNRPACETVSDSIWKIATALEMIGAAQTPDELMGIEGIAALGVLKADVDNLGMIFRHGLHEDIQTLTRISILSRQFNNFFAIYLPHLLRNEYPNIYTVFAGGDDLFLIGPWCDILKLAPVVKRKFAEFVCKNDDITISMGISIHKPNEPVREIAMAAEEALDRSKSNPGKDSVTIFGETVKFARLAELEKLGEEIQTWLSNGMLNTAMLYRFNTAIGEVKRADMAVKKATRMTLSELASALSWKARLKYSLIRSRSEIALKPGDEALRKADLEQMIGWIEEHKDAMRIPLWRAIYSRRKR